MPMEIIPGPNLMVPTPAAGDSSNKPASTQFVAAAIATAIANQTPPCFSVDKNGSDQGSVASNTVTQVTWATPEVYDIGGFFASNVWTPPSGKIFLTFSFIAVGTIVAGGATAAVITKNGATTIFKQSFASSVTNITGSTITLEDVASGSDVYGAAVVVPSTGVCTVNGSIQQTYFMGHWISV